MSLSFILPSEATKESKKKPSGEFVGFGIWKLELEHWNGKIGAGKVTLGKKIKDLGAVPAITSIFVTIS